MRPTSRPQSALRYPLNHILGTEAKVRVLRVIMLSDIPIGVSELARLAALQASGVARVCTRLEDLGVIEAVGRGARNRQYRRAARFAFGDHLVSLFNEERARGEQVVRDIQATVQRGSSIRAAWIEGPVALGAERREDTVVVCVLVEPANVKSVREALLQRLLPIQVQRGVVIDVRVFTPADLETLEARRRAELERLGPSLGPPALNLLEDGQSRAAAVPDPHPKRHSDLDARSKQIAQAVVQDDARAARLRRSSPFLTALSPEERRAIFDAAAERK